MIRKIKYMFSKQFSTLLIYSYVTAGFFLILQCYERIIYLNLILISFMSLFIHAFIAR